MCWSGIAHFGQSILIAASLLGAACYGGIPLIALCVSFAAFVRRAARMVAAVAGAMTLAGLALAAVSSFVPASSEGDATADVLTFVWMGRFVVGLGFVAWAGLRTHRHQPGFSTT